ncbi:MAG: hypothetical protein QM703_11045 [Gemmatales bacterium]
MNRRVITYVLLCTSLIVIVVAQLSFRRPSMWRWMQAEPAAVATDLSPISTVPAPTTDPQARRAPFHIRKRSRGRQTRNRT